MVPVIIISIILSAFIYNTNAELTEEKFTKLIRQEVFNYVEYFDKTVNSIAIKADNDAFLLETSNTLTPHELIEITKSNLLADSIVYGSGIFFAKHTYPKDKEVVFYYTHLEGNDTISMSITDKNDPRYFNYHDIGPEWWKEPKLTHTSGWTKPYVDSLAGNTLMVTYYDPFFFDNIFGGIITIDISLDKLEKRLNLNKELLESKVETETFLVSKDSITIYSDTKERIGTHVFDTLTHKISVNYHSLEAVEIINKAIAGKTGEQILHNDEGEKQALIFFSPLHTANWAALSVLPYADVQKAINSKMFIRLLFIIGFNFLIVLIISLMARYISLPIIKLSKSSLKISEGDYNTKIDIQLNDEIGDLANSFRIMKDRLSKRESELVETNKKFEIIFDNSPIGVMYFNKELIIESYNQKLVDLLGILDQKDLAGQHLSILPIHSSSSNYVSDAVSEGKLVTFDSESKSNPDRYLRINIVPIITENNENSGAIVTIEDITTQKNNTELKIQTEAALKASESKSLFLANMSHEIRTPMNAIIGLSHLIENTSLNTKQQNYIRKLNSSAKLLLGIINDILDFSKIEAGKLSLEITTFNLEKMLMDINNIFSFTATKKNLEFILYIEPGVPQFVKGDELRLKQILINFISNAIKFTHEGEIAISIGLTSIESEDITLRFDVKDTGIGMTNEQTKKVFGAFSQADESTTRKYGGTGLGLSISKRLVELMSGEIRLESEPDVGTTVSFDAILHTVEDQVVAIPLTSEEMTGMKVLVCDDNLTARVVVSNILKAILFEPQEFENGSLLLEHLKGSSDSDEKLILLDWDMPDIDGVEVARRIKQDDDIQTNAKIVLLTAHTEINFDDMDMPGVDAVLYKPITNSILFDTIMNIFGKEVHKSNITQERESNKELREYGGARVLLVDDNEINREVGTELLESMGLYVETAINGEDAVNTVFNAESNGYYSLVFMDLQMPVMDGYDATKNILENDNFNQLPIVAMTADVMEGVKERCLELGMKDFVSKPINPAEVVKAIINWAIPPETPDTTLLDSRKGEDIESPKLNFEKLVDIDYAEGLSRVNNNTTIYCDLLIKFAKKNKGIIDDIKDEIQKQNHEIVKRQLHSIKGVTGNIGANKIFEKIKVVENEFLKEIPPNAEEHIDSLTPLLEVVISSIEDSEIRQDQTENNDFSLSSEVIEKINQSIKLLEDSDTEGIKILSELNISGSYSKSYSEIEEALDDYDFDLAVELLNNMLKEG